MSYEIEKLWTTKAGLKAACVVVRNSHRCGYVEVPKGHPLHGVDYSQETDALNFDPNEATLGKKSPMIAFTAASEDGGVRRSPDIAFDVHGGVTFAGGGTYPVESEGWWFGFDCAHAGDGYMDPTMNVFGMNDPVRSLGYVVEECESLAQQIVELTHER